MKISEWGNIDVIGKTLHITGFKFKAETLGDYGELTNEMVVHTICKEICRLAEVDCEITRFSESSEMITMKAISKARG